MARRESPLFWDALKRKVRQIAESAFVAACDARPMFGVNGCVVTVYDYKGWWTNATLAVGDAHLNTPRVRKGGDEERETIALMDALEIAARLGWRITTVRYTSYGYGDVTSHDAAGD